MPEQADAVVGKPAPEFALKDLDGKPFTVRAEGALADCLQHELDHVGVVRGKEPVVERLARVAAHGLRNSLLIAIAQLLQQNCFPFRSTIDDRSWISTLQWAQCGPLCAISKPPSRGVPGIVGHTPYPSREQPYPFLAGFVATLTMPLRYILSP